MGNMLLKRNERFMSLGIRAGPLYFDEIGWLTQQSIFGRSGVFSTISYLMCIFNSSKNKFLDLSVMPDEIIKFSLKDMCIFPTFQLALGLSHWLIRSDSWFSDLPISVLPMAMFLLLCINIFERFNGVKIDKSWCLFLYALPVTLHSVGILGSPSNSWWASIVEILCLLFATICCVPAFQEGFKNHKEKMAIKQLEVAENLAREGQSPRSVVEIQTDYVLYSALFAVSWTLINGLFFAWQAIPETLISKIIPKIPNYCPIVQLPPLACHISDTYEYFEGNLISQYLNMIVTNSTIPITTNINLPKVTSTFSMIRNRIIYALSISLQSPTSLLSFGLLIGLVIYYILLAFDKCLSRLEFTSRSEEHIDYLHNSLSIQGPLNVGVGSRSALVEFALANQNILALSAEERYFHLINMPMWMGAATLGTFADLLLVRMQMVSINGFRLKYVLSISVSFICFLGICAGSSWALYQLRRSPDAPFYNYYWINRVKITLAMIGTSCSFALMSFIAAFFFNGHKMTKSEIIISGIKHVPMAFIYLFAIKFQLEAMFHNGWSWNISPIFALVAFTGAFVKDVGCYLVSLINLYEGDNESETPSSESEIEAEFISRLRDSESKSDPEECSICHEPFSSERLHEVARTRCPKSHYFHTYCLNRWLVMSSGTTTSGAPRIPTCPQCVQPINGVDQLQRVQSILIGKQLEKDTFKKIFSFWKKYYPL